jgi:hypothetical protein
MKRSVRERVAGVSVEEEEEEAGRELMVGPLRFGAGWHGDGKRTRDRVAVTGSVT